MNTVIKGTTTIEEYKRLKSMMIEKATNFYRNHKNAVENWEHGNIAKIWLDGTGNICIEYDSGKWWHYNDFGEWW